MADKAKKAAGNGAGPGMSRTTAAPAPAPAATGTGQQQRQAGAPAAGPQPGTAEQLRQELAQVTALLQETDEALDEWVAECDRLQRLVAAKEEEVRRVTETVEELKQHVLRLEEQRPGASAASSASTDALALERAVTQSLREQLLQAQTWVKDGLEKVKLAEAQAAEAKARAAEAARSVGEAARLENVRHAQELELVALRAKHKAATEELAEAKAQVGKLQAINAVLSFQLSQLQAEDASVMHWMRGVLRWSARL